MANIDTDALLLDLVKETSVQTVAIQGIQVNLKEHMRRTAQNETMIRIMEKKQMQDMAYVKKHIFAIQFLAGCVSFLGILLGVLYSLKALG